jgi:hypothetical protein
MSKTISSVRLTKIGLFAALYVVTGFIPISIFIGSASFLALNIVITPIIAFLLFPADALVASLIGGLIGFYVNPGQAMFGLPSILLPIAGSTFGSLSIHSGKTGKIAGMFFLLIAIGAYLSVNYPFPFFVLPHILAFSLLSYGLLRGLTKISVKVPLYAYITTMCEQGMMMIFAVHLLDLPWEVFIGILPLMIFERVIATTGSTLLILALTRTFPTIIPHNNS